MNSTLFIITVSITKVNKYLLLQTAVLDWLVLMTVGGGGGRISSFTILLLFTNTPKQYRISIS